MTTILNVDDNEANRYVKSRVLGGAGFKVLETGTGQGALDIATNRIPDLVLLDIRLPDISGIEVCRQLRGDPRTRNIPIVHISATHVGPVNEALSLDAGADIYLGEPVDTKELLSAIRALLRLRASEQGLAAAEERMRLATEGAGIATWDIDVASGSVTAGPRLCEMLGYAEPPASLNINMWLQNVHIADRANLADAYREASENGKPFVLEHRVMLSGGGERVIAPYGKLHPDAQGGRRLIGVALDVTDRRRTEAEREQLLRRSQDAQLAAEDAMRTQDEFLAMLSHELRTPMSAVLGWLHLLKTGRLSAEQQKTALETIERNARVQTQVVNDLLDVSRIVTGKMELETSVVPVGRAIENSLDSARVLATARGVELIPHIERGNLNVRGNPERLQQVFSNLLSNAVKFSPKGGRIDVRLERAGKLARITISDYGEGIAAELLPHVFDRFRQADSSMRRRHGGLGLGLAIVRSLVELHGGRVTAESAGEGKGATFVVTLPIVHDDLPPAAAGSAHPGETSLAGMRVLVVDDDLSNLDMIAQMLRMQGASVMTSADAVSALGVARGWTPDALVLDIGLPEKDGYQLLPELRALLGRTARQLPAIAVTGFASREDAERAMQAGFQAHITKPFDMNELCYVIDRFVRK